MIERAYSYLKEGHFEDAVKGFSECLLEGPAEPKAYQGRALSYFQLKQWAAAASDFLKAKELDPSDPENWIGAAMCLAMENKIYEAVRLFDELLLLQPRCVRAHLQLGQLYYKLGIITKGHIEMDLALASRPSLEERRQIEQLRGQQLELDKRRFYRPDFVALRANSRFRG